MRDGETAVSGFSFAPSYRKYIFPAVRQNDIDLCQVYSFLVDDTRGTVDNKNSVVISVDTTAK
jgi:hypothetical protein